jgi:hypothetical protein
MRHRQSHRLTKNGGIEATGLTCSKVRDQYLIILSHFNGKNDITIRTINMRNLYFKLLNLNGLTL